MNQKLIQESQRGSQIRRFLFTAGCIAPLCYWCLLSFLKDSRSVAGAADAGVTGMAGAANLAGVAGLAGTVGLAGAVVLLMLLAWLVLLF